MATTDEIAGQMKGVGDYSQYHTQPSVESGKQGIDTTYGNQGYASKTNKTNRNADK